MGHPRAVVSDAFGPPEAYELRSLEPGAPGPEEVRVRVRAAGVNFVDVLMATGRYQVKLPLPCIPGIECAGEIEAVGRNVSDLSIGDRVLVSQANGHAFSEVRIALAAKVARIPDAMSFAEAAVFKMNYTTAYHALMQRGMLRPGETLLVLGASGGVGYAAIEIGKALGARVIATAGGAEKCEIARRAGADLAIDYRSEDFVEAVKGFTDGRGADVIYDSVGGETTDGSLRCIAWNGRLLVVGFASGTIPEIAANRILLKNIAVSGVHWSAYQEREPERVDPTFEALFALHAEGLIAPLISGTYPLEEVPQALVALGGRKTHGKLIILP